MVLLCTAMLLAGVMLAGFELPLYQLAEAELKRFFARMIVTPALPTSRGRVKWGPYGAAGRQQTRGIAAILSLMSCLMM